MTFNVLGASAGNYRRYNQTYILGSKGGLEITGTDTGGGKFAVAANAGAALLDDRVPDLTFFGDQDGRNVTVSLKCAENGNLEELADPSMLLYNDNQVMWLAYKLGILNDETRYNTPEIAKNMLLLTDGLFLSSELGREVTVDEIKAMSQSMAIIDQETPFGIIHYDMDF